MDKIVRTMTQHRFVVLETDEPKSVSCTHCKKRIAAFNGFFGV